MFFLLIVVPSSYADKGFYFGAVGGIASYNLQSGDSRAQDISDAIAELIPADNVAFSGIGDGEASAFGVFAGYDFNNFWGLEINYLAFGTVDIGGLVITADGNAGGGIGENDITGYSLVGVGRYPVSDQFDIHFKFSAWRWEVETDVDVVLLQAGAFERSSTSLKIKETDLTFGVGFRYHFTNNVELLAEWNRYVADNGQYKDNLGLTTLGVSYHF